MRRSRRSALGLIVLAACLCGCTPVWGHPGIDEQIADLTARIEKEPANATLFLRRGELHRIHRDWKDAKTDYERARKLDPDMAEVDLCLGSMMLEADKPAEAKSVLDRYLAKRPDNVRGLVARARALVRLGRHLPASEDFARAITNSEGGRPLPDYYLEHARALAAAGDAHVDEAIRVLDRGLEQLRQPVTLQLYAIDLELGKKRYDAALARLDQIASRSPRKETWLIRRGEILELADRREEAEQAYRQALSAIDSLPAGRRGNRAVQALDEQARAALERLEAERATRGG